MARPSKTDQEKGYVRDCWTELRTIEAEYHGETQIWCIPTQRPGVFSYRMVFTPLMGDTENGLGMIALSFQYPNVENSTLAAFLWRKAIALGRMVAEAEEVRSTRTKKRG